MRNNTIKLVAYGLFTALTFVATLIIRIPTPTLGYIHPGDALVLLCGALFNPLGAALCAGIGSALADLAGGYVVFVPATFVIKALCALCFSLLFKVLKARLSTAFATVFCGIISEIIMVAGYYFYDVLLLQLSGEGNLVAALAAGLPSIPLNCIQAVFGITVCTLLYPVLRRLLCSYPKTHSFF